MTLIAKTFFETLWRTLKTFPKPPAPIEVLAIDSKSSLRHSRSSPDVIEGDKKRSLFLTLLTLSASSGGTSIG